MPGPFAHMVAAEQAQDEFEQEHPGLVAGCIREYPEWLQAGAVGPDYPYLYGLIHHGVSDDWADRMHREKSGDVVRGGIWWLYERGSNAHTAEFRKAVAWLAGYLSHVVLDATVHPVVQATASDLQEEDGHTLCEMAMDTYICQNRLGYELMFDEWSANLRNITDEHNAGMDPVIKSIWLHMLRQAYGDGPSAGPPVFDEWHRAYLTAIASDSDDIVYFRHAGIHPHMPMRDMTLKAEERRKFIDHCRAPAGNRFGKISLHFDDVFAFAVENIRHYWTLMEAAVKGRCDLALPELPNWDLDLGIVENPGRDQHTLWH